MNAPINIKFDLPRNIKKLLVGATVTWFDDDPICGDDDIEIRYFFDTKTSPQTDLLLKRYGLSDVSQFASMRFHWYVELENQYMMLNRKNEKPHFARHNFNYSGAIYPMNEKFKKIRDAFFIAKNLEYLAADDNSKNKKTYFQTKFTATVIGC